MSIPASQPTTPRQAAQTAGLQAAGLGDHAPPHVARTDLWCLLAFALAGALVVWSAAPRQIQAGDAGEFTTVMLRGGVPHPSGYPWMRLLGLPARVLELVGLPAPLAAALPCAALGWLGWCLLGWSALRHARGEVRPSALASEAAPSQEAALAVHDRLPWWSAVLVVSIVGLAATSGLAILHVHDAEVWGPLVCVIALVLHVGTTKVPPRPATLGFVLGLATSHHLTAVLLTPFVVGAAWPRETTIGALSRALGAGLAGVAAGLTPLLTLFVASKSGAWRWGDTSTVEGWMHHVLRRDFGTFKLGLQDVAPPYSAKLHRELASLGESVLLPSSEATHVTEGAMGQLATVVGLVVVALVGVLLARGGREATSVSSSLLPVRRTTRWGLLASLLLAVLAFPALANLDPRSIFAAWILERFDLLPLVLVVWVLAIAAARAAARLAPSLAVGLAGALLLLVVVRALANVAVAAPSAEAGVEAYARDVLASPGDPRAVVFGTDDHRTFPALFVATVDPPPTAATYVDASLLAHPWYRARFAPALDLADKPIASMDRELLPTFAAWAKGEVLPARPLYVTHTFSRPVAGLPLEPEGILWRVAIDPTLDRSLDAVVTRHEAALARCAFGTAEHAGVAAPRVHPWSSDLLGARAAPTRALLARAQDEGRSDLVLRIEAAWRASHGS